MDRVRANDKRSTAEAKERGKPLAATRPSADESVANEEQIWIIDSYEHNLGSCPCRSELSVRSL